VYRITLTLASGALAVLLVAQPALAYAGVTGTGSRIAPVITGQPLTVAGSTAVFSGCASNPQTKFGPSMGLPSSSSFRIFLHFG